MKFAFALFAAVLALGTGILCIAGFDGRRPFALFLVCVAFVAISLGIGRRRERSAARAEMERERSLVSTVYEAARFCVVLEHDAPAFWVELADGSVLFLSGQYLQSQLLEEDVWKLPRRFWVRRTPAGDGYDLGGDGTSIDPTDVFRPASHALLRSLTLNDGAHRTDLRFEHVLAANGVPDASPHGGSSTRLTVVRRLRRCKPV